MSDQVPTAPNVYPVLKYSVAKHNISGPESVLSCAGNVLFSDEKEKYSTENMLYRDKNVSPTIVKVSSLPKTCYSVPQTCKPMLKSLIPFLF